ncbi:MAG TPA: hypothetical protein VG941_03030 [Candidatus Paceibacterota bacterium]|nr:hypothetical protein [Candidatus Paceibacterota bacterium]
MIKKILAIILAVIVLGVSYWIYQSRKEAGQPTKTPVFALDPRNCTYMIEGKDVALADGYAEETSPGYASKTITRYFGNEASGDFNNDGKSDVAFLLTQDSGGSGTFFYAAAALGGGSACNGTNAILLGDRIAPQSTNFQDGEIVVNYADRKPGEPMSATPSVGVSKYLKIVGSRLVEVN